MLQYASHQDRTRLGSTYRIPEGVGEAAGSLHLALRELSGAGEAPRVTKVRHITRRWHTHVRTGTLVGQRPTKTNQLTQIHYLIVNTQVHVMTAKPLHVRFHTTTNTLRTHASDKHQNADRFICLMNS